MCGIIGYAGSKSALPILVEGLKRLEYRGYDSAGVALLGDGGIVTRKAAGRVAALEQVLTDSPVEGSAGVAHTRWATHGPPNDANAHPHSSSDGSVALVHNGIIDNYRPLRQFLESRGATFLSETDTEVLAHLVRMHYAGDLEVAVRAALHEVRGTYGLLAMSSQEPGTIVAARKGSPLIVGVGQGEYIVASDAAAILEHTSRVVYLEDGEMAKVQAGSLQITTLDAAPVTKGVQEIEWTLEQLELGGHECFMEKEIFEQPEALNTCMSGRVDDGGGIRLGGLAACPGLTQAKRVILTGCGTAWHAALVGEYLLEDIARMPAETEYASEFRYRKPILEDGTIVTVVSQSGETSDTLAALAEAQKNGAMSLGVVNVVGSSIARATDAGVYLHVGPETGVASTKAFTGQVTVLAMLAMHLGRKRGMSPEMLNDHARALLAIPSQISRILGQSDAIRHVAEAYIDRDNWLYLGRGYNYPVALEGALKLKEISYIHAEGMPAAEMKHGPIALVDEGMPVVFVATAGSQYEKVMSNIEEVRSRGGRVIAVATEGDAEISRLAEHVISVPDAPEPLQPLLSVVPLQLLAYHAAVLRGCDVDKPRNLAKSVTVE